ncbi:MAG: DUF1592 domain-containing protein [Myxococcales bacterium]|nr:DUF1592 domain-containing protein [Myxococcales bacterium]
MASIVSVACSGRIGDPNAAGGLGKPGTPGGAAGSGSSKSPGAARGNGGLPALPDGSFSSKATPLRRLTSTQLDNTVRALFPGVALPATLFPSTIAGRDYTTFPQATVVTEDVAESMRSAASAIAKAAAADVNKLMGCAPATAGCADKLIGALGESAYRRPLTVEEHDILRALWDKDTQATPVQRAQAVVEAILQSPQFLYLDDKSGKVDASDPTRVTLDGYALASRLAYLLWNSPPDAALIAKARAGKLASRDELLAEAKRLLADPRAHPVVAAFHVEYLQLTKLDAAQRDAALFPSFGPELAASMKKAFERFVEHVVFDSKGTLAELLESRVAFVNGRLAAVYGVSSSSSGDDDYRQVQLPQGERAGMLTRAAFAAAHANTRESAPVHRGAVVLERLFCRELEPPPGVNATLPQLQDGESPRERLARHRADPACSACHDMIDPVGFAFESFDAIGSHRIAYASQVPIDASGDVPALGVKFGDGVELSAQLAKSDIAMSCYAVHWLRYALGRRLAPDDDDLAATVQHQFIKSGGNIQALLLAIVGSDTFRQRPVNP